MPAEIIMPNWSAKHVTTAALLPEKLTIGRAYFVDDEHYIVIDHGNGPVIYGNRKGDPGEPGEPIPILQAQIDSLTESAIRQLALADQLNNRAKKKENELDAKISAETQARNNAVESVQNHVNILDARRFDDLNILLNQLQQNANAIITLSALVSNLADNLRGTENIMLKLLLENEQQSTITPLEQVSTVTTSDGYTWNIVQTDDGKYIFTLEQ